MDKIRLALIGYGNVGQAFAEMQRKHFKLNLLLPLYAREGAAVR